MDPIDLRCGHAAEWLDLNNRESSFTEERVWCRGCGRYVTLREKTGSEMAAAAAPAAVFTGAIAAAAGVYFAATRQKPAIPAPCPHCGKTMLPTSIVVTPEKLGFFARNQMFSSKEEFYKGCPFCKTAVAFCKSCGATTESLVRRISVSFLSSKTGYQYEQLCHACKTLQG